MNGESLWSRLAGLALIVEGCEYDRLHAMFAYEFERVTTQVRLVGAGTDRLGEDVSVFREDGTALHEGGSQRLGQGSRFSHGGAVAEGEVRPHRSEDAPTECDHAAYEQQIGEVG
jgi:hypothetical protein